MAAWSVSQRAETMAATMDFPLEYKKADPSVLQPAVQWAVLSVVWWVYQLAPSLVSRSVSR
jgi:hypothetical protein